MYGSTASRLLLSNEGPPPRAVIFSLTTICSSNGYFTSSKAECCFISCYYAQIHMIFHCSDSVACHVSLSPPPHPMISTLPGLTHLHSGSLTPDLARIVSFTHAKAFGFCFGFLVFWLLGLGGGCLFICI